MGLRTLGTFIVVLSILVMPLKVSGSNFFQILHTNDIHSYFDHVHLGPEKGGYANLKSLMDKLESESDSFGIPTFRVDAGDFSEGNIFYMAESARKSFELHNQMGYDIAILGNHDYLMGTGSLDKVLRDINPDYNLVTANMQVDGRYTHFNHHLKPYHIYEIAGKKVAFLGLTTDEFFYTWRLYNGNITNPIDEGIRYSRYLKENVGVDHVIAVTHIGFKKDKELAAKAPWIDLIVGGHSHTSLYEPHYEKSRNGKEIPIVQAGKHGEYLGNILLHLGERNLSIANYELVPVLKESPDRHMASLVEESKGDLESLYGEYWLHHEVGLSEIHPDNHQAQRLWTFFVTDGMREQTGSDVAVHQMDMVGPNFPVGPISRKDLLQAHPRFFELENHKGWRLYETTLRGAFIRTAFRIAMNFGLPLSISGVTFDWHRLPNGDYWVKNLRVDGRRINPFRRYTVTMPEGVIRGGREISGFTAWILRHAEETPYLVLDSMEEKLRREDGVVDNDYLYRTNREHRRQKGFDLPRTYFPGTER